ncbi:restriction endonuclease subunit S [Pseudoalteromonas elyakovii]|nr:restriction endonuclease subunit S [Pseudoalteromonas elyakovii]
MISDQKLESIADIIDSRHKTPIYSDAGYPMVRVVDIKGGYLNLDNTKKVSEDVYKDFSKGRDPEIGDLVFSRVGSYGNVSVVKNTEKFCLGQNTVFIIPKEKDDYLYYALQSPQVKNQIESSVVGAVQKTISLKSIKLLDIPYPEKEDRSSIVKILSNIDSKISNNTAMNATLEKIAQRIFKSWFVDFDPVKANAEGVPFDGLSPEIQSLFPNEFEESELGMIPKGWEVKEIQDVSEFRNGYAFKSKELTETKTENSLSVFKMGNILKGGGFKRSGSKDFFEYIPGTKLDNHLAKKGDLLMCMTDMKANVALLGHTALMPVDDEFLVNQRVGHIRISENSYLTYPFLYLYTNSASFIHEIRSKANSGVQVNLSTKVIKESKIVVPPESIHKQFDNVAKACFEKIFLNELMNNNLSKIRDKLLPRLISGKITIQKAEELLEEAS